MRLSMGDSLLAQRGIDAAGEHGFHLPEMGNRGCIEQREAHGECAGGEFERGEGIADYAGG
jgi:hypothetical protein